MHFLIFFLLLSCGGSQENFTFYELDEKAYDHLINQSSLITSTSNESSIRLSNDDYPIHITLFKDNQFHYDLPTLGDGNGTWSISKGKILLNAKRSLFDMHIEIKSLDCYAENLTLSFIDRFGPKVIEVQKKNSIDLKEDFCLK